MKNWHKWVSYREMVNVYSESWLGSRLKLVGRDLEELVALVSFGGNRRVGIR